MSTDSKTFEPQKVLIDGGRFRVWTKRVGSGDVKILLLHGGPGVTGEYFECFENFSAARRVYVLLLRSTRLASFRPAGRREFVAFATFYRRS